MKTNALVADRKRDKGADRKQQLRKMARQEAVLDRLLSSPTGLLKIAEYLSNPVRRRLDYRGITRNFSVTQLLPIGMPAIYDRDIDFLGAASVSSVKVGRNGSVRVVEMGAERVDLGEGFEIGVAPQVPARLLHTRRYDVLKRLKDRIQEGMEQREDLLFFSYLDTAATLYPGAVYGHPMGNVVINTGTSLTKKGLSYGFAQVRDRRLDVRSILMSAYGVSEITSWTFQEMDQAGMQELRETGYMGNMWGADFFISDLLVDGNVYIMSSPKFLAWTPLRVDITISPADDPRNFRFGFTGYEMMCMTVHNSWAVAKVVFTPTP